MTRKTIQISEDVKKRLDRIKADMQCDYNALINGLCELYEDKEQGIRNVVRDFSDDLKVYYKNVADGGENDVL